MSPNLRAKNFENFEKISNIFKFFEIFRNFLGIFEIFDPKDPELEIYGRNKKDAPSNCLSSMCDQIWATMNQKKILAEKPNFGYLGYFRNFWKFFEIFDPKDPKYEKMVET